jgi:hypothetical protein
MLARFRVDPAPIPYYDGFLLTLLLRYIRVL